MATIPIHLLWSRGLNATPRHQPSSVNLASCIPLQHSPSKLSRRGITISGRPSIISRQKQLFRVITCGQRTPQLQRLTLSCVHQQPQKRQLSDERPHVPGQISPKSREPEINQPDKEHAIENNVNDKPVVQSLRSARERTKAVTEKVKSSLTSLTPRENIYNLPNFLTVSRLFAAPATAYLLLHDHHSWALALFAYAGITDLVDGWLARKWNLQTVAGSVIDPMADKALMIILTVTLAAKGALPVYLATLVLGRDAALAIAAIYYRYASLPTPKTFTRYWDFSLPSAEVHPTTVSKYNTFLQLILIGSTVALPVATASPAFVSSIGTFGLGTETLFSAMTYFQYIVAGTTVWSGLSYAYLKDAVTILGKDEALKAKQGARGRAIIGVVFGAVVAAAAWNALVESEQASDNEVENSRKE